MAIDPVSLAIGGAGSLIKGVTGAAQYVKGKRILKDLKRPEYEIPEEVKKNLSVAERMALEGLPAEQKKQYVENLNRQMGATLSGFSSRKAGLTGLTDLAQTQSDSYKDLLVQDATARQQNELGAMNQRGIMAGYKDKAFELNKMEPYQQKLSEGQGLQGAGMQNIFSGIDELAGTALMAGIGSNGKSPETGDISNDVGSEEDFSPEELAILQRLQKSGVLNSANKAFQG